MVDLAVKRKSEESDDDTGDGREETSKRRKMSPTQLLYQTLINAESSDFWAVYFETTGKQRELMDTKVIPRREEIIIENHIQAQALMYVLDQYDVEKRGYIRLQFAEINPTYTEVRAMYDTALEGDDSDSLHGFTACLTRILEVSNLVTLVLGWMHLNAEIFSGFMNHHILRELVLGDGVSVSPDVNVGEYLEKIPLTKLEAPVRFSARPFLFGHTESPERFQSIATSNPWMLTASGEPRKFDSVHELSLVELDTHHAQEIAAVVTYVPFHQLVTHENLNIRLAEIFPSLRYCIYDVVVTKEKNPSIGIFSPAQLEVFPSSCKDVHLSLRATEAIIQQDRDTAMIGRYRAIQSLVLFSTPFGNPVEIDGEGLVLSFPLVRRLTVNRLRVILRSIRQTSRYFWREIVEVPQWLLNENLTQSTSQTIIGSIIDYRTEKLTSYQRITIEKSLVKSSKTRTLVISSIDEQDPVPEYRVFPDEIPLPPKLKTFVCINDIAFAEKALSVMTDSTRETLRNVWLLRMSMTDIDIDAGEIKWTLEPYKLADGLFRSTLDRLHPDTRVNDIPLDGIRHRNEEGGMNVV